MISRDLIARISSYYPSMHGDCYDVISRVYEPGSELVMSKK